MPSISWTLGTLGLAVLAGLILVIAVVVIKYGRLWLQAYMSGADVSFMSLVGMSLRRVPPDLIVSAQVIARQAGLHADAREAMTTGRIEALYLAGGNVQNVVRALVMADRAGIPLDFDQAVAVDLAGRDVLDSVQISVSPRVIDCPRRGSGNSGLLSAVAKDGVELRVHARITVRTNMSQLIGGATEDTIVARVGQGIISAIGSSATYLEVLADPQRICEAAVARGLGVNSAFEIVSLDIAELTVGKNIGAVLKIDQAAADMRIAQAQAEGRRSAAIALQQEMKAKVVACQALLVAAEAETFHALAAALSAGRLHIGPSTRANLLRAVPRRELIVGQTKTTDGNLNLN